MADTSTRVQCNSFSINVSVKHATRNNAHCVAPKANQKLIVFDDFGFGGSCLHGESRNSKQLYVRTFARNYLFVGHAPFLPP